MITVTRPATYQVSDDGTEVEVPDIGTPEEKAMEALFYAGEQLYLEARRFARAYERDEIDRDVDSRAFLLGDAFRELAGAVEAFKAADTLLDRVDRDL